MKTNHNIEQLIYDSIPSLPSNQKKIAEFFLDNMNLVALFPIKDIAKEADVSEASIVRFSKTLGYTGFKELKSELSTSLKNHLSPTERYQVAATEKGKSQNTIKLVAQNVIEDINETARSINYQNFGEAVNLIAKARQIHCMGLEISYQFSNLMTFLLRLYGYDARTLSLNLLRFKEQIAYLTTDDLLIAFSFSPYSRETVEAISFANQRGISSVVFTDKKTAPICEFCTHCIRIKTDNITFSNSLGAVVTIMNALITELNFLDKDRTLKALKIIENNIKDERYFINK